MLSLQKRWSSSKFFTLTEHSQYIFVTATVSVIASFNKSNIKVCFEQSVVSQRRNKRPVLIKRPVSNKRYLEVPKVNKPLGR